MWKNILYYHSDKAGPIQIPSPIELLFGVRAEVMKELLRVFKAKRDVFTKDIKNPTKVFNIHISLLG
jgi:hypothetical protein